MENKIKFTDIVKSHIKKCDQCFQFVYFIPVDIDKTLVNFLTSFGEPVYNLDVLSLLQIETQDEYKIKGRLTNNYIYFSLPKKFKGTDLSATRKEEFEKCIAQWIESRLPISIIY